MLSNKEKKELTEFINRYKEIETSIELMQKNIEKLNHEKINLLDALKTLKNKENEFIARITRIYGADEVSPSKLLQIYLNQTQLN